MCGGWHGSGDHHRTGVTIDLLPAGLAAAVEALTGAQITVTPRGGGGASREGAELTLTYADGRSVDAYMNYDVYRAGVGDDAAFAREAAILQALSGALAGSGVRAARYIADLPEFRALITEKVNGDANFNAVRDPALRSAIAVDFMRQIATLHRIKVTGNEGLGTAQPIAHTIASHLAAIAEANAARGDDPLITLAHRWLAANIPPEPERLVVVHGDAGPGNFLYAGNQVTALLDWELVHIGDPMADLAMLCLRMLFQPLVPLKEACAAYVTAGGAAIDTKRIAYWRLLFQTGFAARNRLDDPTAPPPPNLGMNMIYASIHRRVLAEALAEVSGVALRPVTLPDAPVGARDRSYALALDDLATIIVPRLSDQHAAVKAKGLARLVKWWRAIERFGGFYDAAERAELSTTLGTEFTTLEDARAGFKAAIAANAIDQPIAIRLCHARVTREAALMADAMGGLTTTHFADLSILR